MFEQARSLLSPATIERRKQAMHTVNDADVISIEDAPLDKAYLEAVSHSGIHCLTASRWLNAISADLTTTQLKALKHYHFIQDIVPIATRVNSGVTGQGVSASPLLSLTATPSDQYCGYDTIVNHYGFSAEVLNKINAVPLHKMGFSGKGVTLGILDCGFNWRNMDVVKTRNVIGEYDFIFHDSITSNQENDVWNQDGHGSAVMAIATGYYPDSVIGPGYNAAIMLAKTEDLRSETPLEEDNYAAALEWMESRGVDITSSSLGYRGFDSGFVSYEYPDLDGKTTISAKAVQRAVRLGVLVCTAAGNAGFQDPPALLTPSDADSILSCGALRIDDTIASFSSNGPTPDGRIKPDICAPGVDIPTYDQNGIQFNATGTSDATPLLSGACTLIKEAHPEATAQQIRNAILQTGILFESQLANNSYGHGRLDAYNAALKLGTIIGHQRLSRHDTIYSVCVPIAANNKIKQAEIVYSVNDSTFSNSLLLGLAEDSLIYSATFPALAKGTLIRYYVKATDGADTATLLPRTAPDSSFYFYIGDTIIKTTSGISTIENHTAWEIYPTPSSGIVTISGLSSETVELHIIDAIGREVYSGSMSAGQEFARLDLSTLHSGTYRLEIITSSGQKEYHRLLIVH